MYENIYYQVVPENIIERSARAVGGDNNFTKLLNAAKEYREADLDPIFLLDPDTMDVIVIVKETFQKKLH